MSMAIVFGSTTGYTEEIAYKLYDELRDESERPRDIHTTSIDMLQGFDVLVIGVPTWNHGQLQSDWADRLGELNDVEFKGVKVAFFGSGDARRYPDNFQDAIGILWQKFEELGAELIGKWPVDGYDFEKSMGLCDDGKKFVGLAFDKYDSEDVIEDRIEVWAEQIREEMN